MEFKAKVILIHSCNKKLGRLFIHVSSLCIVRTENEMQLSVAFRVMEFMMCCSSLFTVFVVYCVSQSMVVSHFHHCTLMSDLPLVPKHYTVGYPQATLDLRFPTSPLQCRMFGVLIDKQVHLSVKILYGNSWSNQYKSRGIVCN